MNKVSTRAVARHLLSWLTVIVLLMTAWPLAAQEPDWQGDGQPDPTAKRATQVLGGGQPLPIKSEKDVMSEGFEDGTMPPPGWTHIQTNPNETWGIETFDPHSGSYYANVVYDPALLDQDEVLLSPTFTADSGSVSLWSLGSLYWCRDTYDNCDLEIWFVNGSWDGGSGNDVYLGTADDDWSNTWEWSYSAFDFSPYASGNPARIAFRYVGNDGAEIALDDIVINHSAGTCNDPHEPNDSQTEATPINYGDTLTDPDICPAGDVDYYVFSGSTGDPIVADIDAQSLSPASELDSYLYLLDNSGNELAYNDDHGSLDSHIEYTLPADGTYYLKVEEYNHPSEGGPDYFYTISLVLAPSFDVHSNWASSPPSIDGHISAGEWSGATTYDITALAALVRLEEGDVELDVVAPGQRPQPRPSSSPVTLYVMNDGSHLYLAFDNPNDTVYDDYDQVGIYFDDNPLPSDGQWTNTTCGHADGEGNFWVLPPTHSFREIIAGPDYCTPVEPAPGVDGTLQFTSGHAQAEVAIDLTNSALRALPGDSVNMYLWIMDYDTGTQDGIWPIGSMWNDPATYRSLTLADRAGPLVYAPPPIIDDDTSGQSNGDGDGIVECGETIELYIPLHNQGSDTAIGVNAAVDINDPYVTWPWLYNTSSGYPDIPGGGTEINSNDFDFEVDPSTPDGHVIYLDLDITASNGGPWFDSVPLQVECGQAQWTFLVYLDGDNNLEGAAIDDFLEMSSVGSTSDMNILVQFDRIAGYSSSYDDWTTTKRFWVASGMTPVASNAVEDIGEANMGDPQTLIDFVQWGMANYPADHYAVVLWDHGSGWRLRPEEEPLIKDIAFDDTSGGDALDMPELRSAMDTLSGGGSDPLDLVGFDACLMGMIEVDHQLIPFVEVRVGSEETEPWGGWPYDDILSALTANPSMSAGQLGTIIVDEYYASYGNDETQSAVDLGTAYSDLASAVNDFAVALMNGVPTYCLELASARRSTQEFYYPTYIDLHDFAHQINQQVSDATIDAAAANVMNLLSNAVIQEHHGSSWPGAHGISIYFPGSGASYATTYDGSQGWLQFTANTQWDEWLHTFYSCPTTCNDPYEPNDGQAQATPINYGDTLTDPDICPAGDVDYYVFSGSAGDVIVADIDAQSLSPASELDSYLYLLDSSGNELAYNDDHGSLDSHIEYALPADGTYYLKVEEYNHPSEGGPDYFYTISLALASSFDVYSNWTSSPPSIDGHISAGEWSSAASYDITALAALVRLEEGDVELDVIGPGQRPQPRPSRSPVTLYVMNDGSHLYLAFDNPNDTVYDDYDQVGIYFDDNPLPSDGQWTNTTCGHADGEGNFWVRPPTHTFREIIAGPDYCTPVEPAPGVDGALQFTSGHAQAEAAIDLTNSALRASPGDSVNMYLWIMDYDTGTQDGIWPIGSVWNDPATYRSLALAGGNVGPVLYDDHTVDDDNNNQSNGDGDGIVECGETIELYVALRNQGSSTATGVHADISTTDPYITWIHNTSSGYPDIPGGGTEINGDDFDFEVDPSTPNGHPVHFDLDISADQGSWTDSFDVPVACNGAGPVIVTIEDGSGSPGSTDNPVTISADNQSQNTTPIAAGEFWVVYDGSIGLTLVDANTTARSTGFLVGWTLEESNPSAVEAHILLYSMGGATIAPGTGPILELLFDVDSAAQFGDSSVLFFSRVSLSDQLGHPIPADSTDDGLFTIGCAKDGDIDDNGATDIFDLQFLINMILHLPQPDPSLYPSDWWCRGDLAPPLNGDGQWNIFDLQRLICLILGTCGSSRGEEIQGSGENVVSIGEVNANPGRSGTFDIDCNNEDAISAAEMWFTYDSTIGLDVSNVATIPRTVGWNCSFLKDENDLSAVEIHVLLFNMSGWEIDPGTGAILSVEYDVDAEASAGSSPLNVTQVNLADAQGQPLRAKSQDGMFHITELYKLYLPLIVKNGSL